MECNKESRERARNQPPRHVWIDPVEEGQGFFSEAFARSINSLTRWPPFFPIFS
jgi:hypothetical protein